MAVRTTYALVSVALVLMDDPSGRHWGYELSRGSGVRPGVMYPILRRMLDEGWMVDGWEDQAQATRSRRPARRYYRLTSVGRAELGAVVAQAMQDHRFRQLATGAAIAGAS
jgi:PadR family transcriptional regulator, regulatory protein PadR